MSIKKGEPGLYRVLYSLDDKDHKKTVTAIEVPGQGCIVESTVKFKDNCCSSSVFVPGVRIHVHTDNDDKIINCTLVKDAR